MRIEHRELDERVRELANESAKILKDGERLYDLVGQRLAWWTHHLGPYLQHSGFRIGFLGNPNRGKTTLSYSLSLLLDAYGLESHYVDLDTYSNSGQAISGEVTWENRRKLKRVSKKRIDKSLAHYAQFPNGVTLGDFPGRLTNKFHRARLKNTDLAIIIVGSDQQTELRQWSALTSEADVPTIWMQSRLDEPLLQAPIHPSVRDLRREANPFFIPTMVFAGGMLREISQIKKLNIPDVWPVYTEAERVVLEEVLDFLFAPLNI